MNGLNNKPDTPEGWSMKWIALALIPLLVGYTFVTLHYRKPNRAYEPYNDLKTRGETHNLLTAGFQRIVLNVELPADRANDPAAGLQRLTSTAIPGGLPADLKESLFDQPALPASYTAAYAVTTMSSLLGQTLAFDCDTGDVEHQLAGAYLYVQGDKIIIAPELEALAGDLAARRNQTHIRVAIPGGALKPGTYSVLLAGRDSSLSWTLQVN
ncbi:MAG: hypothetical protein IT582_03965 [Opitutaceae bacterium]|nr:hypothetical protein [Opitutaceae bacterium]